MTFSFLLVPTPNFQNLEKSAFSCDLKDEKEAKTYYICFVPQARNSRRLPTFASNQFIYCFLEKRRKKSTADQIVLLIQNIEDFLWATQSQNFLDLSSAIFILSLYYLWVGRVGFKHR